MGYQGKAAIQGEEGFSLCAFSTNFFKKLLIFGSLEGLTTLYMRLVRGMAEPMTDIKQVRSYEAEVIENVNYILGGQFQEIGNTEKWTTQTMNEFYECMADFD